MEEHAGSVDDRSQERRCGRLGPGASRIGVAGVDGRPSRVDEQRVGEASVGQGAGQPVDGGRVHAQTDYEACPSTSCVASIS